MRHPLCNNVKVRTKCLHPGCCAPVGCSPIVKICAPSGQSGWAPCSCTVGVPLLGLYGNGRFFCSLFISQPPLQSKLQREVMRGCREMYIFTISLTLKQLHFHFCHCNRCFPETNIYFKILSRLPVSPLTPSERKPTYSWLNIKWDLRDLKATALEYISGAQRIPLSLIPLPALCRDIRAETEHVPNKEERNQESNYATKKKCVSHPKFWIEGSKMTSNKWMQFVSVWKHISYIPIPIFFIFGNIYYIHFFLEGECTKMYELYDLSEFVHWTAILLSVIKWGWCNILESHVNNPPLQPQFYTPQLSDCPWLWHDLRERRIQGWAVRMTVISFEGVIWTLFLEDTLTL